MRSLLVLEHLPPQQGLRPINLVDERFSVFKVLEHLPPQQGLRLARSRVGAISLLCTRTSSTTTRIKTNHCLCFVLLFLVLEHLPPQQGLRPQPLMLLCHALGVLEHLPPQQGLRRQAAQGNHPIGKRTRTSSTTTRIKTSYVLC